MPNPHLTRPPLAKARGVRESFGALVRAAARDAEATRGLAAAYQSLPLHERRRLVTAIVADARAEGVQAAPVLASLLPAETDPALARRIAGAMAASDGGALRPRAPGQALLGGDVMHGGALFSLPLYAEFVEVLTLAWDAPGIVHAHTVPLVRADRASGEAYRLPPELALVECPVPAAVNVVRDVLWRHRRQHGRMPDLSSRLADLIAG